MEIDLLIKRFQDRDALAFEQLYNMYWSNICGVGFSILQDREEAEELAQDVFVKIWEKSESYNPVKGRFFTWILNITRNAAIDKLRSKSHQNQKLNLPVDYFVGILEQADGEIGNKDHSKLKQALKNITAKCAKLIQLLYFNGLTQKDASLELDIPLGTIKSRNRNCITRLRENLS